MRFFNRSIRNRSREPTRNAGAGSTLQMVSLYGEYFYGWNGKLYESDIVRSCIRPKVKAVGKLAAKHIQENSSGIKVNHKAWVRILLRKPNPLMTMQQFLEKMTTQLCLSNNAFALIIRDKNGYPTQLYPIPASMAEAIYGKDGTLYIKFTYRNGKTSIFYYDDLIHLRQDYNSHDVFGDSPGAALSQLMECVGIIDQGIVKAIKNSGIIRWFLRFSQSLRPEDIQANVKTFVDDYLTYESETFGAAGVDAKADAKQIEPKDYVPNALITQQVHERLYSFFNTNKKIVQSNWTEDDWNAYFEAEIEPLAIQLSDIFTNALFSVREQEAGNRIVFEASNLQCASLNTKLAFQAMVDRGAMLVNEWRATMNLAPVEGGDKPIRRLDTQVVDLLEDMLAKMNSENYMVIADLMKATIKDGFPKEANLKGET
ncbi:MAG: phage portal protein [Lachnospiraceae bacterium]|nr:phage portal protein [Lachnospiraceae bacterium]